MPLVYKEAPQRHTTGIPAKAGDEVSGDSTFTRPNTAPVFRLPERNRSGNTESGNGDDERAAMPGAQDSVIYDYLRNMAIDILLQVVQELAGFGANGELSAVGRLVREVPKICRSAAPPEEKVRLLSQHFYNTRQNMGEGSPLPVHNLTCSCLLCGTRQAQLSAHASALVYSALTSREGTNTDLSSRFAAVRVRPAHRDYLSTEI